jgi:glyoxylase-like metal-dependent hydrolase (beta-lactamase superfamily II)
MLGLELPDVDVLSSRVTVALGQNPSVFTGPGTNTYLIGTGRKRVLLDTGEGRDDYMPVLEEAVTRAGCEGIQEIVLTHGHRDHLGGVAQIRERFGPMEVHKLAYPDFDDPYALGARQLEAGGVVETEGATLRAHHTPGHAPDHLVYVLEEENAMFSGDNVLGVGTTVIPVGTGDLGQYLASLEAMLELSPDRIYPAHGPVIEDGRGKIREYIAHRLEREVQIVDCLKANGPATPMEIVRVVYAAYPEKLYDAAAQSVTQHLLKLERDGRVSREGEPLGQARWNLL